MRTEMTFFVNFVYFVSPRTTKRQSGRISNRQQVYLRDYERNEFNELCPHTGFKLGCRAKCPCAAAAGKCTEEGGSITRRWNDHTAMEDEDEFYEREGLIPPEGKEQDPFEIDGEDIVGAGRCQCALSSPPPILEYKFSAPHSPDEETVGGVGSDGLHREARNRDCADEAAQRGRSVVA